MVKSWPVSAGDTGDVGLIPGLGRFPGEGNGNIGLFKARILGQVGISCSMGSMSYSFFIRRRAAGKL